MGSAIMTSTREGANECTIIIASDSFRGPPTPAVNGTAAEVDTNGMLSGLAVKRSSGGARIRI